MVNDVCPATPCGLAGAYVVLKGAYPKLVSPAADAQINVLLASATATGGLIDQLKAAAAAADQAADIRGIESVGNQVLGIIGAQLATTPNIPQQYTLAFFAATTIIQALEMSANQIVPNPTVGAPRTAARFYDPGMTKDQALARLRK